MNIEFLSEGCPGRKAAEDHIKHVFKSVYGANVTEFAPMLVVAKRDDGQILCAAGIRTAQDGFFSDAYLDTDFSTALQDNANMNVPASQIMEIVSLASTTPFPVLPMMDKIVEWGRENGMTCGVFTATKQLRRLLKRTALTCVELASADVSKITDPEAWGSYYDTEPKVCAFSEDRGHQVTLSPRAIATTLTAKAS